jgi:hypothetical protein
MYIFGEDMRTEIRNQALQQSQDVLNPTNIPNQPSLKSEREGGLPEQTWLVIFKV